MKLSTQKLAALSAVGVMAVGVAGTAQARQGADDPAGHKRGADDVQPHFKRADDRRAHKHHHRGHGRDDGLNHR